MGKKLLNACSMHSISLVYIWNILLYLYHLLQMRPYKDRFVIQPLCHALEFRFSTRTSLPRKARPCCITSRSGWSRRRRSRRWKRPRRAWPRPSRQFPVPVPFREITGTVDRNATGPIPGSIRRTRTRQRTSRSRSSSSSVTSVTRRKRSAKRLPAVSRCVTCRRRSAKKTAARRVTRRRRRRRTTSPKFPGKLQSVSPSSGSDGFKWTDSSFQTFP